MNSIPIIYYHSVALKKNLAWFKNYLTLELKFFEAHLKYFAARKYVFLDLADYFALGNQNKKENYVVLTLDDGYLDNFIYVYPLLKKYNAKATIFINPAFVDKRSVIRKTFQDYWNNKVSLNEIDQWGFLSWDEMRLMEKNGTVDIQSHTLTHTKYFVSDELVSFHYPNRDCLYPIGNLFPEHLPYYIANPNFEKLLPYGYPFLKQESSVIARKVTISKDFIDEIMNKLNQYDWSKPYNFNEMLNNVKAVYENYKKNNAIITKQESDDEYKKRVHFELSESKRIIEKELNKKVSFCCWPHGDNNEFTHNTALEVGYKATSLGKFKESENNIDRFGRIGLAKVANNLFLTNLKTEYKIKSFAKKQPFYSIKYLYNLIKP